MPAEPVQDDAGMSCSGFQLDGEGRVKSQERLFPLGDGESEGFETELFSLSLDSSWKLKVRAA